MGKNRNKMQTVVKQLQTEDGVLLGLSYKKSWSSNFARTLEKNLLSDGVSIFI